MNAHPPPPTGAADEGQALAHDAPQWVYLDTEFTDLGPDPWLLSVGMVVRFAPAREFYAEVNEPQRLQAAGAFARSFVIPQFGRCPGADCSYAELGARASGFLANLVSLQASRARLNVAFESECDWTLLWRAVAAASPAASQSLHEFLHPMNIYNMPGFSAGEHAASAYFERQKPARIGRHHALCDARALKIYHEAAQRAATRARLQPA